MFNHMRVRRMWAYITRGKKEKARLKQVLGAELAKDLDSSYRNAFLCVAIEEAAIWSTAFGAVLLHRARAS